MHDEITRVKTMQVRYSPGMKGGIGAALSSFYRDGFNLMT